MYGLIISTCVHVVVVCVIMHGPDFYMIVCSRPHFGVNIHDLFLWTIVYYCRVLFTYLHGGMHEYKDHMVVNACSSNKIDERIQACSSKVA
jgi:hypothetical protein